MSAKTRHCLPSKDIVTICDVYNDIRFDFAKEEVAPLFLEGIFGNGKKHLTSVTVNGKQKWGMIDKARLAKIVDGLMSNHAISSKWSANRLLEKLAV